MSCEITPAICLQSLVLHEPGNPSILQYRLVFLWSSSPQWLQQDASFNVLHQGLFRIMFARFHLPTRLVTVQRCQGGRCRTPFSGCLYAISCMLWWGRLSVQEVASRSRNASAGWPNFYVWAYLRVVSSLRGGAHANVCGATLSCVCSRVA